MTANIYDLYLDLSILKAAFYAQSSRLQVRINFAYNYKAFQINALQNLRKTTSDFDQRVSKAPSFAVP